MVFLGFFPGVFFYYSCTEVQPRAQPPFWLGRSSVAPTSGRKTARRSKLSGPPRTEWGGGAV